MWRELSEMKTSDSRCHGEFWDRVAQADCQVPGDGIPFGEALASSVNAMRAPIDDWKGVLEAKALRAANAALAKLGEKS